MIKDCFATVTCGPCDRSQVFASSMRWPRQLLQAGRHRRVCLLAALLAIAPSALVLADARAPALLAFAPDALVLADARAPALLAFAFSALAPKERLQRVRGGEHLPAPAPKKQMQGVPR